MTLKNGENKLYLVGTLKSKNLELKSFSGFNAIVGSVVIEWSDGNKLNNTRARIFSRQSNKKGYKSLEKLMKETKDKDSYGDAAEKVALIGSANWNLYKDRQDMLRENVQLNINFAGSKNENQIDTATLEVDLIVSDYKEETDKEGELTGNLLMSGYNVNISKNTNKVYITPFKNLLITKEQMGDDLEQFPDVFPIGTKARFQVTFENYAEVDATKPEAHGFGKSRITKVATNHVTRNEITRALIDSVEDIDPEDMDKIVQQVKDRRIAEENKGTGRPTSQPKEKESKPTFGKDRITDASKSEQDGNADTPDFFDF